MSSSVKKGEELLEYEVKTGKNQRNTRKGKNRKKNTLLPSVEPPYIISRTLFSDFSD